MPIWGLVFAILAALVFLADGIFAFVHDQWQRTLLDLGLLLFVLAFTFTFVTTVHPVHW